MEYSFQEDDEGAKLYNDAIALIAKENHINALEILEDLIFVHGEAMDSCILHRDQGKIFLELAETEENPDVKFAYWLGSVECFENGGLSPPSACSLSHLANHLGSVMYYKKCLGKAREGLLFTNPNNSDLKQWDGKNKVMKTLIEKAEFMIAESKTSSIKNCEPSEDESKKSPEPSEDEFKGLRSYWLGLDIKIKRDFMKVSIAKLRSFVEGVHKRKGRDALDKVLDSAREDRKWTFWMCRTKCSKKFSSAVECKSHLEQLHAADFKLSSQKDMDHMVKRIGKDWARKIWVGGWEPVDALAAVEIMKNRLADVKAFAPKNGWSKEWPLAADEERSKLLKEIKLLLVSFCDRKILSCSIRDRVMLFAVKNLGKLEVSEQNIVDYHLKETPQTICFLECRELNHILGFLKTIKCERDDGTDLVCRAVDSVLGRTRVKEKIDFDPQFSFLLLDRRLLKNSNITFDDEGTINVFDPNGHYAKAPAQGDYIISWLTDYNSVDMIFPGPIREHNPGIWLAVLKAVQFTCRTLRTKYAKKMQVIGYDSALFVVEYLCLSEDERRKSLQKDQWNRYASLLCDRCEERFPGSTLPTKLFLCAVRDVLEGASHPTFDFPNLEDCLKLIRERKSLSDNKVLQSINLLKSVVTHKVLQIDSKILLIDNSRISLLNNLARLSVFDNRTYILQLLKPFLLNEILNMESKAKSDAAEADLLLAEEKRSQSKKKNDQRKKAQQRTSTSMSSPLNKTVEHKNSVNLEPESTSPSLKPEEEGPMEPEDALASERGLLEISSKTQNQEEATHNPDMQNMPGEDSLSAHFESALGGAAARYNSALDMTLKALLNIKVLKEDLMNNKQPFQDHLEEQVPSALQNLFTAFVSEVIKNEGVYSCLLNDLLASLEEAHSLSSDAAKVVVAILEFWRCWKNPERESLVTHLFTLAENERISCRKCRRITNYPEQSSYTIVMAADSIRDLKCALGSIKFVDILKMIRMEYQNSCKTGGCGKTNFVHHIISRCPPIFTIVLKWEKSESEKEISETTMALEWEIDISRLYGGLEPNTNYRLVSMVGSGEVEEEHICLAYEKNRWVNLRRESLAGEDVGNWKNVVRLLGERKFRPEILFYEAVRSMA